MLRVLIFIYLGITANLNAQVISQFIWDSNPVTNAEIGPNATSVSSSAISSVDGAGGTRGLNAGLPKQNLDFIIPVSSGVFDVNGIDVSFDYQREELVGTFFQRGTSLIIAGCDNLSVRYLVEDGSGGTTTVSSGNVYTIPNDDTFRNYRFYYAPASGYGALLVDGIEVWNHNGPDNRNMHWAASDNIIIGNEMDGSGTDRTFLDNLTISEVSDFPLPIELGHFDAIEMGDDVSIEWQTLSEINNDFFTIERSTDAVNWEILEKIDGAGNSTFVINYQTIDQTPFSGLSYYRLKQTDFNSDFSYSEVKSVFIDNSQGSSLKIYPNPSNNIITIEGAEGTLKEIQLYNSLGQNISNALEMDHFSESKMQIDISSLKAGFYFVKTESTSVKIYKK